MHFTAPWEEGLSGRNSLITPRLTLCVCLLPHQNARREPLLPPLLSLTWVCFQPSSQHSINHLPYQPLLLSWLFLFPLKHSQSSQLHVCSPLPLTSLSLWLHKLLKVLCFPAQLDWPKHAPCSLTTQLWLPPISFFAWLTHIIHSDLSLGPPPPGSLPWPRRLV